MHQHYTDILVRDISAKELRLPFDKLSYQINPSLNIVTIHSSAVISFADLIVHMGNVMMDEAYYVGINSLFDFSKLTQINGNKEVLYHAAEAMNDIKIINRPANAAILVSDSTGNIFDIFSTYLELTQQSLIDFRIFDLSQLAELKAFLALPANYSVLTLNTEQHNNQ